jgi:hypothetical protein
MHKHIPIKGLLLLAIGFGCAHGQLVESPEDRRCDPQGAIESVCRNELELSAPSEPTAIPPLDALRIERRQPAAPPAPPFNLGGFAFTPYPATYPQCLPTNGTACNAEPASVALPLWPG